MTDPHPTSPFTFPSARPQSVQPLRAPYLKPHIQPLGRWSALTLVISVPIGPGSSVFKNWNKP